MRHTHSSSIHSPSVLADLSFTPVRTPRAVLQRKCACGNHTGGGTCDACAEREATLRRSATHGRANDAAAIPPVVNDVLHSPGQPLDAPTRAHMESHFAHDFSGVRVHADARAAESANAVSALAYTVGRNVVFGAGQYTPTTAEGRKLLAHELTHVVQQSQAATAGELRIGETDDPSERVADDAASRLDSGAGAPDAAAGARPATLQRQPAPDQSPFKLKLSPLLSSAVGSTTVDGFETGKADLTEEHKKRLAAHATTILRLLGEYPDSFISVVGHTDAVGADKSNTGLGQQRAEAVLAELAAAGVPAGIMRTLSLGESSPLVATEQAEPRNRRVEVLFSARNFFQRPTLTPPTPWTPPPTFGPSAGQGGQGQRPNFNLPPTYPFTPQGPLRPQLEPLLPAPSLPPITRRSDPLDDALDSDPLLRALPKIIRGPIKDALKRGDEKAMEQAVDSMDTGSLNKGALKAALKALLRSLRGERWQPPTPPLHQPPLPPVQFPKMPGEKMFDIYKGTF